MCVVPHVCVCYQGGCKSLGTGCAGGGLILCRWGLLWAFAATTNGNATFVSSIFSTVMRYRCYYKTQN